VNDIEYRIRAAVRAAASTVLPDSVPPLRLPPDAAHPDPPAAAMPAAAPRRLAVQAMLPSGTAALLAGSSTEPLTSAQVLPGSAHPATGRCL